MREHIYKIRKSQTKGSTSRSGVFWSISVPQEVGELLAGRRFKFTMTEEGLLYIPLPVDDALDDVELPSWAQKP